VPYGASIGKWLSSSPEVLFNWQSLGLVVSGTPPNADSNNLVWNQVDGEFSSITRLTYAQRTTTAQLLTVRWSVMLVTQLLREYPSRDLRDNLVIEPIEPMVSKGLAWVAAILATLE
jgi:hypothetical protein